MRIMTKHIRAIQRLLTESGYRQWKKELVEKRNPKTGKVTFNTALIPANIIDSNDWYPLKDCAGIEVDANSDGMVSLDCQLDCVNRSTHEVDDRVYMDILIGSKDLWILNQSTGHEVGHMAL